MNGVPSDRPGSPLSSDITAEQARSALDVASGVSLVTSRDLIGPRPHQVMLQRGIPFAEVMVQDIMTPAADIEVIPIEAVLHARVGDVVMTLKNSGRQHALVVEEDSSNGKPMIRGIFSASQIARQLGIVLQQHELSQTFAQIDQAVKERS